MRDKFTNKDDTIPLFAEVLAGACVSIVASTQGVGWGGGCPVGLQLRTRVQASGPQWEAGKGVWQLLRSHCSSLIDFDVRDVKQAFVLLL